VRGPARRRRAPARAAGILAAIAERDPETGVALRRGRNREQAFGLGRLATAAQAFGEVERRLDVAGREREGRAIVLDGARGRTRTLERDAEIEMRRCGPGIQGQCLRERGARRVRIVKLQRRGAEVDPCLSLRRRERYRAAEGGAGRAG